MLIKLYYHPYLKNKNYLGINKLKLLSKLTKKVIVLGGISKKY